MERLIEIKERFCQESNAIDSQIKFVENSVILPALRNKHNNYIDVINTLPITISEAQEQLNDLITKFKNKLLELKECLDDLEHLSIPNKFYNVDIRSTEGECIDHILNIINQGETNSVKILEVMQFDLKDAYNISKGTGYEDFYLDLLNNVDLLMEYIDACLKIHNNQQMNEIEESIQIIEYYLNLFILIDTSKTNNLYRQAFIQLIAIFDAIVFDCIRTVFQADFFKQLKLFKDGSIKYSEIANYQDFEAFKTATIEAILKNCHLKDLLSMTYNHNKSLFTINNDDKYTAIREIINRRNCHIHRNGIVDNLYVKEFNIYNHRRGDFLKIDKSYFNYASELCSGFVSNFVEYFSND